MLHTHTNTYLHSARMYTEVYTLYVHIRARHDRAVVNKPHKIVHCTYIQSIRKCAWQVNDALYSDTLAPNNDANISTNTQEPELHLHLECEKHI